MATSKKETKVKKQTPRGGKPRETSTMTTGQPSSGTATQIYSNVEPITSLLPAGVDYRSKDYKGGSAKTFVGGRGVDMTDTVNRNFVGEVNRHERALFRRRAREEIEAADRASRADSHKRIMDSLAKDKQRRADRDFERETFNTREGWDNLGRSKGRDKDGKEVSYGRGSEGVENYDQRYEKLKRRADILTKAFEVGDYTGRGKEWASIRKLVADTHANGGLTEKQLSGIEAKMETLLGGLNDRITYQNKANKYRDAQDIANKRKALGDTAGLFSDEQVRTAYDKNKWNNVRSAIVKYEEADPKTVLSADELGNVTRSGARINALNSLLGSGISATQMAGIAIQSGQGPWADKYNEILASKGSDEDRTRAIEDLGVDFLKHQLGRGEAGVKALNDAMGIKLSGTPEIKTISWDEDPSAITDRKPDFGPSPSESLTALQTPIEARGAAENATILKNGGTITDVLQPGPTVKRADESVQRAGDIAETAARAGVLAPALTPKGIDLMKKVPGDHQRDGTVGEVTPIRAAGLVDIQANLNESLMEAGVPLIPRKKAAPVPEPRQPSPAPESRQPSPLVLHGGRTGEHAVQTVETGFDRAANKLARKVKSWFD